MTDELRKLQTEYNALCQRIEPHDGKYTFLTKREDVGAPHVEFENGRYHYVVTERGLELSRRSTADAVEILYWMIKDMTFWMGVAYEFKNPILQAAISANKDKLAGRIMEAFEREARRRLG